MPPSLIKIRLIEKHIGNSAELRNSFAALTPIASEVRRRRERKKRPAQTYDENSALPDSDYYIKLRHRHHAASNSRNASFVPNRQKKTHSFFLKIGILIHYISIHINELFWSMVTKLHFFRVLIVIILVYCGFVCNISNCLSIAYLMD